MRSRIAGEIEMHSREIDRLRAELVHLDATMQLFDPETDPTDVPSKYPILSCKGNSEECRVGAAFGTGVSCCLPPRKARPFRGEIRPSDLSFPWPFQRRSRLLLLSARSGEQSLFDDHQIGQGKQSM